MLVFALYKREAARLEQFLQRNNYDAVAVHGDKGQVRCFNKISSNVSGTVYVQPVKNAFQG